MSELRNTSAYGRCRTARAHRSRVKPSPRTCSRRSSPRRRSPNRVHNVLSRWRRRAGQQRTLQPTTAMSPTTVPVPLAAGRDRYVGSRTVTIASPTVCALSSPSPETQPASTAVVPTPTRKVCLPRVSCISVVSVCHSIRLLRILHKRTSDNSF